MNSLETRKVVATFTDYGSVIKLKTARINSKKPAKAQYKRATRTMELDSSFVENAMSRPTRHYMAKHKRRLWLNLSNSKKVESHLIEIGHDLKATLTEWAFLD